MHMLSLESIGDGKPRHQPPYVARLIACNGAISREFVRASKDYAKANRSGLRGVMLYYAIHEDEVYEIREWTSPRAQRTYYLTYYRGAKIVLDREDAFACLER